VRRLGLLAAALVGIGCYAPTYLVGLQCSPANTCPPGQGCNRDGICMPTATLDAGGGGRDAGGGSGGAAGARGDAGGGTDGGATDGRSSVDAGPRCGDGNIDRGEECDDDNTLSGDGCSSTCQIEGLVGHWALGTQYMDGTTVPDLVTPGHGGAIVNVGDTMALVANHFGTQASAISIMQNDALSDLYAYVRVAGLTALTPPLTMTIWINRQGGNGMGLVMGIDQGPQLYEDSYAITMRVPSSANNYSALSTVPLAQNQWVFVAGVFSETGGVWQLTLYTNETPTTGMPAVASVAEKGSLEIGGLYERDGCSTAEQVCDSGFVGYLNDARIYGRALTAQEIGGLATYLPTP